MTTNELIITRGLPGSGKSTWARAWADYKPSHRVRVNRDDTRKRLFGSNDQDYYIHPELKLREDLVTEANRAAITAALAAGFSVVVDDTNLPVRRCRELARLATQSGATVKFETFDTDLEICLERNRNRTDKEPLPDRVIEDMYTRFVRGGLAPVPASAGNVAVDYSDITPVSEPQHGPETVIVDIDGTVAQMVDRGPHDYHRVSGDACRDNIADLVSALSINHKVVFVSGRTDAVREQTEAWLRDHAIPFDVLYMRKDGDHRVDWKVKYDIFNEHIRDEYNVKWVLDDRTQVVKMWRALGLDCLQVAEGDF